MNNQPESLAMIGQTLGHYRIESKLGEGGMGVVFRARDTHLDRDVAIKVLPPEAVANAERKRRFVQEAKAASSLNHPNIIHIYDIDTANGVDFIAMEFVPGRTLDQLVGRKGLGLSEALKYAIQIADALARAHGAGIIHRDLKPGNIMVTPEGLVKVLDFGLAKLAERDADDQKTLTVDAQPRTEEGTIVGTVAYMSPEQAQGGKVDARSDIFSFGAVLYEMTTGQRAFQRQSRISTLAAILHEEPKPITESLEAAPHDLEKIIARCLRKDPDRRSQHMADIKTLLEDLKDESESGQLPTAAPKRGKRLSPVLVGLVAVLLAATAFLTWRLARSPKPARSTAASGLSRLTSDTGLTSDPALSPDGKLVAYASDRNSEGNLDIWVQQAGTGEALRLTSNAADEREPAFSPDGSRIAYRSEQEGGGVYVVSSLGGEPRRIAKEGRGPRFSPSGESIAYWTGGMTVQALIQGKVYVAPASGGEPRQIQPQFHSAAFPLWSPDGKSLLFLGARDPGETSSVARETDWWITPLEGDRSSAVKTGVLPLLGQRKFRFGGFGGRWITAAAWLPDQPGTSRFLFSASVGDARNIWQIAVSDKTRQVEGQPERLTFGAGSELLSSAVALPSGGARLTFASLTENLGIWSLPLDANRGVVTGNLRVLTPEPDAETRPSISLDGKKLIYQRQRGSLGETVFKDLVSGKESVLATAGGNAQITRDGSKIAYMSRGTVYALLLGRGDPEPICEDCFIPTGWSADGAKLLDEAVAGRPLGLVVPGQRKRIPIIRHPSYALSAGRFSPDDRWIAFHAIPGPTSRRIFVAPFRDPSLPGASPIEEKDWIPITDGAGMERYAAWSPDGNLLYFLSERDGFRCLRAQRLDPSTKRPIGAPVDVYHFHSARLSLLGAGDPINVNPAVAADKVVFGLLETTGNIWMTELAAPAR